MDSHLTSTMLSTSRGNDVPTMSKKGMTDQALAMTPCL